MRPPLRISGGTAEGLSLTIRILLGIGVHVFFDEWRDKPLPCARGEGSADMLFLKSKLLGPTGLRE